MSSVFYSLFELADRLEQQARFLRATAESARLVTAVLRTAGLGDLAEPVVDERDLSESAKEFSVTWRDGHVTLELSCFAPRVLTWTIRVPGSDIPERGGKNIDEKFTLPEPVLAALRGGT